MNYRVSYILAFITVLVLFFIAFEFLRPRLWVNEKAEIHFNGKENTNGITIYRGVENNILVKLDNIDGENPYIYYPTKEILGMPNLTQFFFTPIGAFSKDVFPPVVFSNDKVKVEHDFRFFKTDDGFGFTTIQGNQITIMKIGR